MTQLEFFTALANGAKWGVPATISRSGSANGGLPIDAYSIFDSKEKAELYASQNKAAVEAAGMVNNAYVGQIITVWEKVPVIGEDGQPAVDDNGQAVTADDVSVYYIDADKTLKPVGIVPTGDGATIEVTAEGAISLAGFAGANTGYLPRKAEDGTLEWVPISAVVQSDGNTITTLTSSDGSVTIEKTTDTDTSLVYDLKVAAYDDSSVKGRLDTIEADYLKAVDRYNDTEVRELIADLDVAIGDTEGGLVKDVADNKAAIEAEADRATKAEAKVLEDAKAYTDTEIDGLTVTIEKKDEVEYIVIKNKAGEEVASADASKFVQDSFLNDVSYDAATGKVSFVWTMGDGSTKTDEIDIAHLVDTYTAGNGIAIENNVVSIDPAVVATVEELNKVKETAEAAQTADEVASAISTAITNENLGQYAKTSEVETALAGKVDSDTYTADKNTFAIKSEVETALGGKVDNATLDSYYTSAQIDNKGYAVAAEVTEQFTTVGERIDAVVADTYNKEAADAKFATIDNAATKEELAVVSGKAEGNTNLINNLTGRLDGIVAQGGEPNVINTIKVNGVAQSIDENKAVDITVPVIANTKVSDLSDGAALVTQVGTNTTAVNEHGTAITNIQNRLNSDENGLVVLNTRLSALETEVGVVAESRIDGLESSLGTLSTAVGENTAAITSLGLEDTRLEGLIAGNTNKFADYSTTAQMNDAITSAIAAEKLGDYAKVTDVEAVSDALAEEAETARAAEKANADAISALIGDDKDMTIRAIAAAETAKIVAGADADYDTLKEIAEYIASDKTNAAGINNTLAAHNTILAGIGGAEDEHKSVTAYVADYVNDAIAALVQPKASAEITVANDGTLGIGQVSTDKLVQGVDTLVLSGGSATA